jgi:hypothetical protein
MCRHSTRLITSLSLVAAALTLELSAKADQPVESGWDWIISSPNLPPQGGQYVSPSDWHAYYGMGIYLQDVVHSGFTQSFPPPAPGGSDTHSFGSTVTGLFSTDGGMTFQSFSASGLTAVRIDSGIDSGNIRNFSTEMLQLNVSGGSLPNGVMLRESPTLASVGETSLADFGDGTYGINSFFDIYTELSLDGGMTWFPDLTGPAHATLTPEPSGLALVICGALTLAGRKFRYRR